MKVSQMEKVVPLAPKRSQKKEYGRKLKILLNISVSQ